MKIRAIIIIISPVYGISPPRGAGRPAFGAGAEAMAAVRADWEPPPRVAMREAHMRREIRRARREGYPTAAVIAGAWHVPALDVAITTASADQALLRGRPKAKVAVAWVPWGRSSSGDPALTSG